MKDQWSASKDKLVGAEEGSILSGEIPSGSKSSRNSNVCKQLIQCVKLILYLELLLFVGWACYSTWQTYRIESMEVKAVDSVREPEPRSLLGQHSIYDKTSTVATTSWMSDDATENVLQAETARPEVVFKDDEATIIAVAEPVSTSRNWDANEERTESTTSYAAITDPVTTIVNSESTTEFDKQSEPATNPTENTERLEELERNEEFMENYLLLSLMFQNSWVRMPESLVHARIESQWGGFDSDSEDEESSVDEKFVVDEKPTEDEESIVNKEPIEDEKSVVDEKPIEDEELVVNEEPTVDEKPTEDEEPTIDEQSVVNKEPIEDEKSVVDEEPTVNEESVVDEEPTVDEQFVVDEKPTEDEKSTIDEKPTEDEKSTIDEKPTENEKSTIDEKPTENEQSTVDEKPTEDEKSTINEKPTENEKSTIDKKSTEGEKSTEDEQTTVDEPTTVDSKSEEQATPDPEDAVHDDIVVSDESTWTSPDSPLSDYFHHRPVYPDWKPAKTEAQRRRERWPYHNWSINREFYDYDQYGPESVTSSEAGDLLDYPSMPVEFPFPRYPHRFGFWT